jgi:glycosyltransferase involved in cell wall biosynthesis
MKSDITVIILTFNEERHIQRCVERIKPIASEVFVVDCFSGSGTTAVCCQDLNRNFKGCEINKEYFDKSIERINLRKGGKSNG